MRRVHCGWRSSFLPPAAVLPITLPAAWRWPPAERHFERSRSLAAGPHGIAQWREAARGRLRAAEAGLRGRFGGRFEGLVAQPGELVR